MIIVTGATGKLGHGIVNNLLERIPAEKIGVSVRDTSKANDLKVCGVRVMQGDYKDANSLAHAFEGASQVLIVSSSTTEGDALIQHRTAIESAKLAGASRILYTSHIGAKPNSGFADHAATEAILKESGVAFTSLRNGFYASSAIWYLKEALETGELIAPQDGPVSWAAHADLAEIAAVALVNEGCLDGITPPLAPIESLNFENLAAIASEITGRSIKRITLSDEDFVKHMVAKGYPEQYAKLFLGLFIASRNGELESVDSTFEHLLGRKPISVRDLLVNELNKGVL